MFKESKLRHTFQELIVIFYLVYYYFLELLHLSFKKIMLRMRFQARINNFFNSWITFQRLKNEKKIKIGACLCVLALYLKIPSATMFPFS